METQVTLFSLLLLLAAVSGSPQCNIGCQGKSSSFQTHYEAGHTYVYNFEGHTVATLPGQQGDGVKLHLKATAEASFSDNCKGVLSLKNVHVTGPDAQKYTHLADLEAHPVTFSYENGLVGREICVDPNDPVASVNVKRGVLSALQVAPTETTKSGKGTVFDVFGHCPAELSYNERGGVTYVTKARNLNKCHLRENLRQDFASVTYHVDSDFQTTPLLEATQELKQQVKGGVVSSAESHEKYLYRPFANQDAGSKTIVHSKLSLVSHSAAPAPAVTASVPRLLVFEVPHVSSASSNVAAVVSALHKAHHAMPDYVGETAAREFANVVKVLRQTSKDDLLSVYGQVKAGAGFKNKDAGTKMFLDALFRAGTGDAVEVAVELLKSNKITGPYAELYYLQFAYTKHVTRSALTAAATLLDQPNLSKLAYLGVGALAGRYCAEHECEGVPEVDAFLERLSQPLNGGCKVSSYDEEIKVVATLKALHNVHHLTDAVVNKLKACVEDKKAPTRVRAAVLDTLQSDACRVKETSLAVFKDTHLDSELRIKAFLALVECPCNKMANALKEALDSEPTYQVGAFVTSYLRNLRASANPSKERSKAVYGEVRTTKRFPIDFRKFSNNFEFSYLFGGLNLGTTVESNVIYSQKSFLPRATSLNLTTELFGHSVNFLEVEFRQENLDLLAEGLFGPKGYFKTHSLDEVVKTGKEKWTDFENTVKQRLHHAIRGKRSVTKEQLSEIREKSESPYHAEPDRELSLELSTKLFGAEVGWFTLHHNARDAAKHGFDTTFHLLDKFVKKAKNFDHKVRQHNTFLDTELIYPTSLGFPLKLVASGSSAVHFELEGKVDVNELVNNVKNSDVHFKLVPSASVEIVGSFVVDAYAVEAGLKVAATLHTATGADVTVKSTGGVGVDVTVGLPVKKQDIVTLKSEVLTTVQERGKAEVNTEVAFPGTPRREYQGCFDQLSPLIGLTFCGTMNFPWDPVASKAAFYPLNGPSKLSLVVENEDVTSYHFHASFNTQDPKKKTIELLLETPGSKTDRKLGLLLERTYDPYQNVKAQLTSPWKQVSAELAFTDDEKELSLLAKVTNDAEEYYVKLGASVTGDPAHATYHPLLEYKTPEKKQSLFTKKGVKGSPEKLQQPFNVAGSVTVDKSPQSRKYTFNDVVFTTPHGEYKVDGSVTTEGGNTFGTDLKVYYAENHIVLKSEFKKISPTNLHVTINAQPSQYPDFGVNLVWDYKREKNHLLNSLAVIHGRDPNSADARFTLNQEAHYQFENIRNFDFSTKNRIGYPLLGLVAKVDASVAPKKLEVELEAAYEKHRFEAQLNAKHCTQQTGDYDVDFKAKVLDSSLRFETRREVVSPEKSKFTTELEVQPGGKYEVVADVTHHFERNDINFQVDAVAKVHGQPDAYTLDSGLVFNQQLFDTHYKLTVGSVDYVDVSANYKRAASGNPSGSAKVSLKNYLVGNAQFKYAGGKGSATLNVDIPKLGRKLKGTGDLQVTGSRHVATVELYYNDQQVTFNTDTDFTKTSLDSKNVLNVLEHKTEFNVKGTLTGKLENGQLKGEFDATLPCGSKFEGKLDQTLHVQPSNSEGDVKVELTATPSGSAPAKVTLEFAAKNVDTKQYSFDGQSKLAYHASNGKDVAVIVTAKNIPQREQRVIEAQGVLQGSLIGEPLRVELNSEVHEPYVTYKGHGSYGSSAVVDLKGKVSKTLKRHEHHYEGPFSFDNTVELKLPFDKVKHIKYVVALNGELGDKKFQFTSHESLDVDDRNYKLDAESNNELEKGNNKFVLTLPNHEPKTYVGNWYFNYEDFKTKDIVKGGLTLAAGEDTKFTVDVTGHKDYSDLNIHATLNTPFEKLRSADLTLKNKYNPSPRLEVDTDLALTIDDKKITIVNKLTPGPFPGFPNIDFTATHPEGKTRVFVFLQSKSKNDVSGKAELEWATNGGGKLTAAGKATYESLQNFKVEADVESAKLNLKKWHVVLSNKPAKTAKTILVQATEAGAPVVNGRLEYHVEDKENSYKAGVSGNVKVRDQQQHLKADVFYVKFTPENNEELGAEAGVSIHLGEKKFDAVSKHTNKESKASVSLCYEAGKCSVAQAHSLVRTLDFNHLEHDFGAKVDLKSSGINEGFVLAGKTTRQPLSFDHAVELKLLNSKQTTYKVHSYLNEKSVGLVATLPQRVIAAEGKITHVKEKGEHKVDLAFWLDKVKQPDSKAALHLLVALNPSKEGTTFQGDAKFSHPALQKDFAVTSKAVILHGDTILDAAVDFDVFAKKNQKVTVVAKVERNNVENGINVTAHLSAKGKLVDIALDGGLELSPSGLSYETILTYVDEKHKTKNAQVFLLLTLLEQQIYVKSPKTELLKLHRQVTKTSDGATIKGDLAVVGTQPTQVNEVVVFPVSRKVEIFRTTTPNKKLVVNVLHDLLTGFSVRLTKSADGANSDILYVGVDLTDDHFLRTHFTWSTEELKKLLEYTKHDAEEFVKQVNVVAKSIGTEVTDELQGLLENLKKAQPDVKGVIESYKSQIKTLAEELENDEGFTEASENVKKIVHAVTKVVVELTKKVTELSDHALEVVTKLRAAVQESVGKLLPKFKELYNKVVEFTTSVASLVLEEGSKVLLKVADFVKEHEDEIKKLVEVVKDFFEDIGKVVGKTVIQVRNEVVGFVRVLVEQVKALPLVTNFKEQYKQFVSQLSQQLVPEQTWPVIKEIVGPFRDSLPTDELRDLAAAAEEYIDKHINHQPVNDAEELQALLNKALKALKSLLSFVTSHLPKPHATADAPSFLGLRVPLALNAFFEFPRAVAFRFSPLHFLTSGDIRELPTLQELLLTLKPTLNPLDWLPPYKAHGVLIDMNHFVSVDGRHFTFKGSCAYVLLQDVVDGNFSVALDFASKSLVLSDKHDTVELSHDSTFKVNGEAAEYPHVSGDFVAWKDFGAVSVMHRAGLFVKCDTHQSYCFFYVNGFYFGKTQGLLGVLDYEPFDDFKKPDGEVVTNVNDFGNSWKVTPSCGDVSGPTHHDHHMAEPAECASVFGGKTPLRFGYLFTPVTPYREACSHFVADASTPEAKQQAACTTAAAYVTAVRSQYLPVSLPPQCVHCSQVEGSPVEVGETVSVRLPKKTADVVIVVEQVTQNSDLFKDLITPLVTTLSGELKSKGISDVHFTLIGYGEATHYYPAIYTTGGKLTFEGKTKNIKFTDHVDHFSLKLDTCENRFKYLKAVVESELGLGAPSQAYQFASKYPFKVGSSKVLVGVVGTTKTSAFSLSLQQLGALYSTKVLRDRGVSFHLVAPVEDLQLAGSDAKTLKSVVGFDSHRVYTLSDAKKKEGSTELRKNLSYKNNIWIPIALDSYGVAYVAQNFNEAKPAARKQFLNVFSHRIAESLLIPIHEDCKCRLVNGLYPFSECKVTSRQERETLAPLVKGKGVKG